MNILITGTSSGLGHALALQYLRNGATVFGISRTLNESLLDYSNYQHLTQDLGYLDDLPGKLKVFLKDTLVIDLVILNASVLPSVNNNGRVPVNEASEIMQVNVWANKVIIDTLLRNMRSVYQIVAFTSGQPLTKIRELHTYNLSKSILTQLIQLYAWQYPGTHFCSVSPGITNSRLQDLISSIANEKNCPVIDQLKKMKATGQITSPAMAANILIEIIGGVLQGESGSCTDAGNLFPINQPKQHAWLS